MCCVINKYLVGKHHFYKMKTSYDAHSSAFGYKSLAEEGGQALGSDTIAKKVALRSDYQQKHKEITVLL